MIGWRGIDKSKKKKKSDILKKWLTKLIKILFNYMAISYLVALGVIYVRLDLGSNHITSTCIFCT